MDIRKCLSILALAVLLMFSTACNTLVGKANPPAPSADASPLVTPLLSPSPLPEPFKHNIGEARSQIDAWLIQHEPEFSRSADDVLETNFGISDLYDRTSAQFYKFDPYVFALYGDSTQRFLSHSVLLADTADVDGDGRQELVLLCDIGSGRYIYQLVVLKSGVPYTYTVANSGAAIKFCFNKQDENHINLYSTDGTGVEMNAGQIVLREGALSLSIQ